jgi:hypothetical protein
VSSAAAFAVQAFRFPTLTAGQSETFTWAYMLRPDDLLRASGASVIILQPVAVVSGASAVFSASASQSVRWMSFELLLPSSSTRVLVGNATVATVPASSGSGGVYEVRGSVVSLPSGVDVTLIVTTSLSSGAVTTVRRTVRIENAGPVVTLTVGTSPAVPVPYLIDGINPFTATVNYASGPSIASVTFFVDSGGSSQQIAVVSSTPFTATVPRQALSHGDAVTVRALVSSPLGARTSAVVTGVVLLRPVELLSAATSTASRSTLWVFENATVGSAVASASVPVVDPTGALSYVIADESSAMARATFDVSSGSMLVVKDPSILRSLARSASTFEVVVAAPGGSALGRFQVTVVNVNDPPTEVVFDTSCCSKVSVAGSGEFRLGVFRTTDPDNEPAASFTYALPSMAPYAYDRSQVLRALSVRGDSLYITLPLPDDLQHSELRLVLPVTTTDAGGLSLASSFPLTLWCAAGFYSDVVGRCIPCESGFSCPVGTTSSSLACASGYYGSAGKCLPIGVAKPVKQSADVIAIAVLVPLAVCFAFVAAVVTYLKWRRRQRAAVANRRSPTTVVEATRVDVRQSSGPGPRSGTGAGGGAGSPGTSGARGGAVAVGAALETAFHASPPLAPRAFVVPPPPSFADGIHVTIGAGDNDAAKTASASGGAVTSHIPDGPSHWSPGDGSRQGVTTVNLNDMATPMGVPLPGSMLTPPPPSSSSAVAFAAGPNASGRATVPSAPAAFAVPAPHLVSFDRALEGLRASTTEQQVNAALLQLQELSLVALHTLPADARAQLIRTSTAVRLASPGAWTGDAAATFGLLLRSLTAAASVGVSAV